MKVKHCAKGTRIGFILPSYATTLNFVDASANKPFKDHLRGHHEHFLFAGEIGDVTRLHFINWITVARKRISSDSLRTTWSFFGHHI